MDLLKIKYMQIEVTILLTLTTIILELLFSLGIIPQRIYPLHEYILLTTIIFVCVSKLLGMRKKYNTIIIISHIYFVILCAALYYSINIADFIAFTISMYILIKIVLLVNYEKGLKGNN